MITAMLLLAQVTAVPAVQCDVTEQVVGTTQVLFGACGTSGVMIGPETDYKSLRHLGTGAVLALVRQADGLKVYLVHSTADGSALLEDLTGDIAKAVGRVREAGIDDVDVDVSKFMKTGVIALAPSASSKIGGRAGQISVIDLIAAEVTQFAQTN